MKKQNLKPCIDCDVSDELIEDWTLTSLRTIIALQSKDHNYFHTELARRSKNKKFGPFRELYAYWCGDNYLRNNDVKRGRQYLEDALTLNVSCGSICSKGSIKFAALDSLVFDALNRSEIELAINYSEKYGNFGDGDHEFLYKFAKALEGTNAKDTALEIYEKLADSDFNYGVYNLGQKALRNLTRLKHPQNCFELEKLIDNLTNALVYKDYSMLQSLVSETHFQVGLGCHAHYADHSSVLEYITSDLKCSKVKVDDISRRGTDCLISTSGWSGDKFNGSIKFRLFDTGRGWQWTSVTIDANPNAYIDTLPKRKIETNQPLPFGLLAPWDKGYGREAKTFMAGGLYDIDENPIINPRRDGILGFLTFIPIVGNIIRAANAFFGPVGGLEGLRRIRLASRSCGFGLRGYYYNTRTSHNEDDAFAVDFTDYDGFRASSEFWPVLTSVGGRVIRAEYDGPNDDDNLNIVELMTRTEDGDNYVTRYLHLAYEDPVYMRIGMNAPVGTMVGRMQDTGNSFNAHLHFSVHDQQRPYDATSRVGFVFPKGRSVRLIPIEGISLGDDDESTCIASSQGGRLSISITSPDPFVTRTQLEAVIFGLRINGGAHPYSVEWRSNREPEPFSSFGGTVASVNRRAGVDHFFRAQGRHTVTATVTDGRRQTVSQSVDIFVQNVPATAEIRIPENGETYRANEAILLGATTLDPESNRPLSNDQISWFLDGESVAIALGATGTIRPESFSIGSHTIRLLARDGELEIIDEVTIEVIEADTGARPAARIISPIDGDSQLINGFDDESSSWFYDFILRGRGYDAAGNSLTGEHLVWTASNELGETEEIGRGANTRVRLFLHDKYTEKYIITLTVTDSSGNHRSVSHSILIFTII